MAVVKGISTRDFLIFWWVQWLLIAVGLSFFLDRSVGHLPGTWVLQAFTWAGSVWIMMVGNVMATGSFLARGWRDWP